LHSDINFATAGVHSEKAISWATQARMLVPEHLLDMALRPISDLMRMVVPEPFRAPEPV
jgi:hypothetical protein